MSLIPFRSNLAGRQAYDPFHSFRGEMERLFDSFSSQLPVAARAESPLAMRVDVSETDKEITVKAELPGVDEKNIDVQLNGDVLTIRGEKSQEKEEKQRNYHLVERQYGSFARSLRLPFEPKDADVKASFKQGVLSVSVAKPAELKPSPKKIEVKAE
jgi:HSP20 family protein